MITKKKKWKIILIVTSIILIICVLRIIIDAIYCYTVDIKYPCPALGIDIHNWYEQFRLDMVFFFYIMGIPLIIDIVLLIIAIIKLKRKDKKYERNQSK